MKNSILLVLLYGALLTGLKVFAPTPVPCYDFMDASANVIVLFNKCTGNIELRKMPEHLNGASDAPIPG